MIEIVTTVRDELMRTGVKAAITKTLDRVFGSVPHRFKAPHIYGEGATNPHRQRFVRLYNPSDGIYRTVLFAQERGRNVRVERLGESSRREASGAICACVPSGDSIQTFGQRIAGRGLWSYNMDGKCDLDYEGVPRTSGTAAITRTKRDPRSCAPSWPSSSARSTRCFLHCGGNARPSSPPAEAPAGACSEAEPPRSGLAVSVQLTTPLTLP